MIALTYPELHRLLCQMEAGNIQENGQLTIVMSDGLPATVIEDKGCRIRVFQQNLDLSTLHLISDTGS